MPSPRTLNARDSRKAISAARLSYCEPALHTALRSRAATVDDMASVVANGRSWAHGLSFQAKIASRGLRKSRCRGPRG